MRLRIMQLTKISLIEGSIELVTGLHIGAGNEEMHIGGTDNPVVKNPVDHRPYIPGSSLKGKMRSLMEWRAGTVADTNGNPIGFGVAHGIVDEKKRRRAENILELFGGAPERTSRAGFDKFVRSIGPSRLAFWDCPLDENWAKSMDDRGISLTEVKMENTIDRIGGAARNPRTNERVPAGTRFDFKLTMRVHDDEKLFSDVLCGLRLIELTGLGGSGSRGYGKVRFLDLVCDRQPVQSKYEAVRFDS